MLPSTRTVLFRDVPKPGGTSLRDLVSARFGRSVVLAFERYDSSDTRRKRFACLDRVHRPSDDGGSDDSRLLGIAVSRVALSPR
jgi:hypothetical protein